MIHDISIVLHADLPRWPGSQKFERTVYLQRSDQQPATVSSLSFDAHYATHVDAPCHFSSHKQGADTLDLNQMIGPAKVVDFRGCKTITAQVLSQTFADRRVPDRLLFKTDNSALWHKTQFEKNFCALDADAAQWLVQHQCRLVGIDYLSIQSYTAGPEVHEILLQNNMIIVEGLNLADIKADTYELICLPLAIANGDGAPARVVLRDIVKKKRQV